MRRFAALLIAATAVAACADETPTEASLETTTAEARTGPAGRAEYEVTVQNLTAGQPMTPPAVAIHRPAISLFEVGEPANEAIREIAENGNLDPAVALLSNSVHVSDFGAAFGPSGIPPLLPGETTGITLVSERGAKLVSFAAMLICTNDGFTGIDDVRLPAGVGESVTVYGDAYDAGTEINTEDFADIVPPCQGLVGVMSDDAGTGMSNPALVEDGVIRHHPGVTGGDDLEPGIHGWEGPVVRVTVTRIN
jgi:hypothetical protein